MPNTPTNELPGRSARQAPAQPFIVREDIPMYLAFVTERYPLLIDVFDRVARELIKEGVDLRRLLDGDLSVLASRPSGTPPRE
ncbi:MAG: hypothetical protein JWP75_3874 [Frondihabitans sp.]|nr:hypothetical protein [Frondihabitans sp.]